MPAASTMFLFQHLTPFPTDKELNAHHDTTTERLLGGDSFRQEQSKKNNKKHLNLILKEKLWTSSSESSSGIAYADSKTPFEVQCKGREISLRDRCVLRHRDTDKPVAVILNIYSRWENSCKIYGLHPLFEGQVASKQQQNGQPLYAFAEVIDKLWSLQYKMKVVPGGKKKGKSSVIPIKYKTDDVGSNLPGPRSIRVTRRGVVCALLEQNSWFEDIQGQVWSIKISPGIDALLMICLTIAIDGLLKRQEDEDVSWL